jgi:hypothetical protein
VKFMTNGGVGPALPLNKRFAGHHGRLRVESPSIRKEFDVF